MEVYLESKREDGLTEEEIRNALCQALADRRPQKVLIIPPDFTRYHSNGGFITNVCYHMLTERGCLVDILPAVGTHEPISREQFSCMYGDIPFEKVLIHDWRKDVEKLGEVPGEYLSEVTGGIWEEPVDVEVNRLLFHGGYDLILSVGQVVPHEVVGMSNHSKNIFVGVGGKDMINKSHMVGAVYGLERIMGKDHTPVRKLFDYAQDHYLGGCPLIYILTVTTAPMGNIRTHGLFIGEKRAVLEHAVALSQKKNIDFVNKGIRKCIVYLDPKEFKSTWLGNKAVYRTQMALKDGAELIILAPGVNKFGEDAENDRIIRKYGYRGRENILELYHNNRDLRENMSVAAHLIHGSSDGRFQITYAVKAISQKEIRSVGFESADYDEVAAKYCPDHLDTGWNILSDGEEVFYIPNPALGLWIDRKRFEQTKEEEKNE